jgi:hypothetical protein
MGAGMKMKHAFGRMTAAGLGLLLLTGGVWVGQTALHPPVAQAYKNRVDVRLDRLRDETYQSLIRRAEIVARAAAQRSFDRDILMSEVSVMVIAEYQGAEAPLLMLEVSRQNWRQRPDTRRWATYYRTARTLLKLPSAADPARPNAGGGSGIPQGIPDVDAIEAPIAIPQTVPAVPGVDAPANDAVKTPTPTAVPVPSPSAAPNAVPSATPSVAPAPTAVPATSPKALPAVPGSPQAVPQSAPKATPKPTKPAKPSKPTKAQADAAAKAAAAAAKAAEAAADRK